MDYQKMLARAKKNLPKKSQAKERFEIPKVKGHIEGNKTIVVNFQQICQVLGREKEHLLKFLLKELAAPGEFKNKRLVIGTKVNSKKLNQKIREYAEEFVICQECGKPDTKIEKEERQLFIRCLACGAKHPVRTKI